MAGKVKEIMRKFKGTESQKTSKTDIAPRDTWENKCQFILSCLGYSVGLSDIWRFPYLAYENGGGAFLIPYLVSVLCAGLPLYYLELALGQYSSLGSNRVFASIAPLFQGLGWGMVMVSLLVALYYNMILAWSIFYFFASFRSTLVWSHCLNDFNTELCHSDLEDQRCRSDLNDSLARFFNKSCYNGQQVAAGINATIAATKTVFPADEFFNIYMLNRGSSFENAGSISWQLVLCLGAAWLLVFVCICQGVKSTGKVVYFTATFPYVVLTALLVRGVTLDGAADGLYFYFYPRVERLADYKVWKDAAEQMFFSLGPAFGGLIAMASYNKFKNNIRRDAIFVVFADSFTSAFAGIAIFSVTGFMAKQMNVPVSNVTQSGMGLAFIAYPEAMTRMPISPLWSVLFFFMLILLGLDSEFAMFETVTTAIMDEYPRMRRHKAPILFVACFILFLLGIPFCAQGGIYYFIILNDYSAGYCVIILCLVECLVIAYVYGLKRFTEDVRMMLGSTWKWYTYATLGFIAPVYMILLIVLSFVHVTPSSYGDYVLPNVAQALGWVFSLVSIACIPIFALYRVANCLYNKQPLRSLITPTDEWCPAAVRDKREEASTMRVGQQPWSVTKV